jgi:hypothetical protein
MGLDTGGFVISCVDKAAGRPSNHAPNERQLGGSTPASRALYVQMDIFRIARYPDPYEVLALIGGG